MFPRARLCELGKIKIGGLGAERPTKAGGTWRMPEKHSYFTITGMNRSPAGDLAIDDALMRQLIDLHGDQPEGTPPTRRLRSIPIYVLSNDVDDIMQTAFVWYGGKACGARTDSVFVDDDGQPSANTVTWFNDPATGARLNEPKTEPWRADLLEMKSSQGASLFKLHTVFNCVIAAKESRWGGVYKFRTTSIISWGQLRGSLLHLSQLTGGILIGLPLRLKVNPITVAPQGKVTTVHVVHVELVGPDFSRLLEQSAAIARHQLEHQGQARKAAAEYRRLLLPPGQETTEEAAEIGSEFHPETTGDAVESAPHATVDDYWANVISGGSTEAAQPLDVESTPPPDAPPPPEDFGPPQDMPDPKEEPQPEPQPTGAEKPSESTIAAFKARVAKKRKDIDGLSDDDWIMNVCYYIHGKDLGELTRDELKELMNVIASGRVEWVMGKVKPA